MKIKLQNVRLSFPMLFTAKAGTPDPKTGKVGEPKFGGSFLLDPTDPAHAAKIVEINAAIDEVAKGKWAAKGPAIVKGLRTQDRVCLHDGNTKAQFQGYEGMMFVSTTSTKRPLVIDRDKSPLAEADGKIYAGCYVNATIEIWPQANSFGNRVNAQVLAVQFAGDGDAFGAGGVGSVEDFDDLAGQDLDAPDSLA